MNMSLIEKGNHFEDRYKGSFAWTAVLTGSTALSALFMFLVHVIAVRILKTEQYGEFSSAIALVGIVGVAASSIQAATVHRVKNVSDDHAVNISPKIEFMFLGLISISLGCLAFFLIGVSLSTAFLLVIWVPAAVMIARVNGELQGREIQTVLHGTTAIIAAATLIISSVVLGLWTDIKSLLIARLAVTILFSVYLLRALNVPIKSGLRFINTKLIHSTILVTTMWFAANMDVLLSRAALGKEENGEIAIAAMLVNSVLLVPGLIAAVLFPRIIEHRNNKTKLTRLLLRAICLSAFVQFLMAMMLIVLSEQLVNWLAGPNHNEAIKIVTPLSLAYIPLGVSIVVAQFILAIGNLRHSLTYMFLTMGIAVILLNVNHDATAFVQMLLGLSCVLVITLIGMSQHRIIRI
jgi:O-antigen/teichoic acid export membrane protein